MKNFMNKTIFASLFAASLIALLPACGGSDDCVGGVCKVSQQDASTNTQVEEQKEVDAQGAEVLPAEQPADAAAVATEPAPEQVEKF